MTIGNQTTTGRPRRVPTLEKKKTTNGYHIQPPQATTYTYFNYENEMEENNEEQKIEDPLLTIPKKKKSISENHLPTQNQDNNYDLFNHEEQEIKTPTTAREMTYNLIKALEEWCSMSQEQRYLIKIHEFAEKYRISYPVFGINVNQNEQNGLSQEGEDLLSRINNADKTNELRRATEYLLSKINNECENNNTHEFFNHEEDSEEQEIKTPNNKRGMTHALTKALEKWRDMPQKERDKTTLNEFAERYKINYGTFHTYADQNGLKQDGDERLLKIKHNHKFNKLEPQHVEEWRNMDPNNLNLLDFTKTGGFSTSNARKYVTPSGGVTQRGQQLLEEYDGHEFHIITPEILEEWRDMPQGQRDKTTPYEFAQLHNVKITHLVHYINAREEEPLRIEGKQLIQKQRQHRFKTKPKEAIQRWGSMSQDERDKMHLSKFCEKNNLYYGSFQNYVNQDGITDRGKKFLNQPDKTSTTQRHCATPKNRSKGNNRIYKMIGVKKEKSKNTLK